MTKAVSGSRAAGFFLGLMGIVACGGSSPPPAQETPPTPFDLPTAISAGGPVLAAPRVQAIYFPSFAFSSEIDAFLAALHASTYWPAVVAEYGVGALTVVPSHVSSVAAPATIAASDIQGLLAQVMTADAAALGAPSSDTIYALFFPATTTLTIASATLCQPRAPSAFHAELTVAGTRLAAAVIPSCATYAGAADLTGAAALTPALAHELVESATDPFLVSAPAYKDTDAEHALWSVADSGGEIADLCENEVPNLITPTDIGFPVPRIWSNAAVQAGTGPCVPIPPGEVYFVAVPILPDRVPVQRNGMKFTVPGLIAPVGADVTVQVEWRSETGMPDPWTVGARELHATSQTTPQLATVSGRAGQTLTVPVSPSSVVTAGVFPLVVGSITATARHFWIGAVERK